MPTYSSTISLSAMRLACSLSMEAPSSCDVFSSVTGVCSQGGTAPGSMTCSDTRHIFCLTGSVSSTDSPCKGLSTITVGLGVCDQSCTSSVSHSMYLSKSPTMGSGVWVSVCLYSTVGSPGGGWMAFGAAGIAHRMG